MSRKSLRWAALIMVMGCSNGESAFVGDGAEALGRLHGSVSANGAEMSPLDIAIVHGDAMSVRALLSQGANVNERDGLGRTPLHLAAMGGAVDVAIVLVDAGADVHAVWGPEAYRPIHLATQFGTYGMISFLLAHGADVNARDAWLRAPLHLLAESSWARARELGPLLLSAHADPTAIDLRGMTAVHVAARSDCLPLIEVFAASSPATLSAPDVEGETAIDIALDQGNDPVSDFLFAERLVPADPTAEPPLLTAARFGDVPRVAQLIAIRRHPVAVAHGVRAIELARAARHDAIVQLLTGSIDESSH